MRECATGPVYPGSLIAFLRNIYNAIRPFCLSCGVSEGLQVSEEDLTVPQFNGSGVSQACQGPGYRYTVGADHGGKLLMGVASWDLVAFAGPYAFVLDEL